MARRRKHKKQRHTKDDFELFIDGLMDEIDNISDVAVMELREKDKRGNYCYRPEQLSTNDYQNFYNLKKIIEN